MIKITSQECQHEPNQFTLHTDERWLARIQINGELTTEQQREHVRHLVASWNACLGLDVACLEENGAAGMTDVVAMAREIAELRAKVRVLSSLNQQKPVAHLDPAGLEELKYCNGMSIWAESHQAHEDCPSVTAKHLTAVYATPVVASQDYAQAAITLNDAWLHHTGAEPSESVLGRAIDQAATLLLEVGQPQSREPVGINGLTQSETNATMSVRGLST